MEQSNKHVPLSSWNRLVNWNILNLFNQSFWPASTELHLLFDVYPLTHLIYQVKCLTFFSSVQSLSHVQLFATPWIAAHLASLSITNSQSLLKLMSIQPSHPLSSPSPPDFNLLSGSFLRSQSVLCIRWTKYWSFSFSISPSNEYSGLISFRMNL